MSDCAVTNDDVWVSAHLYYHADLDVVLHRMVAPLVAELAARGMAERYFFIRHWDGGPHLRLRVLPCDGRRAEVELLIRDRASALFRRHPALGTMDSAAYRAQAPVLAAQEGLADPLPELRPNNSLAMVDYRPEHDRFGYGVTLAAVERHFGTCSQAVLDLLASGATTVHRSTVAFSLIVLAWLSYGDDQPPAPPPPEGLAPDPAREREWQDSFDRQAAALQAVAGRIAATLRRPPVAGTGMLARWQRSLAGIRGVIDDPQAYLRVADICAHLACNRLGLSMGEEGHLRYLAERALRELPVAKGTANVA